MKYNVYLINSEQRLLITSNNISNNDYIKLMDSDGFAGLNNCKLFCIGYIVGNKDVVNSIEEFK
jgi:hypothetical protein